MVVHNNANNQSTPKYIKVDVPSTIEDDIRGDLEFGSKSIFDLVSRGQIDTDYRYMYIRIILCVSPQNSISFHSRGPAPFSYTEYTGSYFKLIPLTDDLFRTRSYPPQDQIITPTQ